MAHAHDPLLSIMMYYIPHQQIITLLLWYLY